MDLLEPIFQECVGTLMWLGSQVYDQLLETRNDFDNDE